MTVTTTATQSRRARRALSRTEVEMLLACYQHRFLSTSQLHRLFTPTKSLGWTRKLLTQMGTAGLVAKCRRRSCGEVLWFVTDSGRASAELGEVPVRPYRVTRDVVAGPLQDHTVALNDAMIAFVETARTGDHECGPFNWDHEVAYRRAAKPTAGKGSDLVIADAVLHFVVHEDGQQAHRIRFIELDRATTSSHRLAAKLHAYAELRRYQPKEGKPQWRIDHLVFPKVVVVMADKPESALYERIALVSALCRHDPLMAAVATELSLSFTTLAQLQIHGPLARIFTRPFGPHIPVDLLGRP